MRDGVPLRGIQGLRAVAALAVVGYHAAEMPGIWVAVAWPSGAAGVDVFFVVSGFVMVVATQGRNEWRQFLWARLVRIVPLYWLCSLVKIVALLAVPVAVPATPPGWRYCAASLLFLPVHDLTGRFKPVLPVGWTLSFEMMFYGLFAASLAARLNPALWVPPVLVALAALPHGGGSVAGELCNPIVLEFGFGTTIGTIWLRGWRLPGWAAVGLGAVSLWLLFGRPDHWFGGRVPSWGLPAAGLVAATVSVERSIAAFVPAAILAVGDASYSIYLTHGFVLFAMGSALRHVGAAMPSAVMVLICGTAASAAFGWTVHITIERPFMRRWASSRFRGSPAVVVLAGGGLAPASGGVGVLMGYLLDEWSVRPHSPRVRVIDTRGSRGRLSAIPCFVWACLMFIWLGMTGRMTVVHAHMTTRGSVVRKSLMCSLAMLFRVPVILHMHGADFIPFYRKLHPRARGAIRAVLRQAHHVIVLGDAWRCFLIEDVGVGPLHVSVVLNGVPKPAGTQFLRRPGPKNILFMGRLGKRKGVQELIEALGSPALRQLAWRATIAGDGDPAAFHTLLREHGLEERVTLPGWVTREKAALLLAEADMLVLPSHHEAMPMAVLEALAASVAVIATPVGSIPEFLRDGENALLVPAGSASQLAEAIIRLLKDADLRDRLAKAGHRVFLEQLDIGVMAERLARLYREAPVKRQIAGESIG